MYLCSGCGKFFSRPGGHAKHRVGNHEARERRCLSTEEMIAKGFEPHEITEGKNAGKTVWRGAAPKDKPVNWSEDSEEEGEDEELPD